MARTDNHGQTARAGTRLLEGRVALITGASRGIGAATARLFGAQGAAVAVNYHRSPDQARDIVDAIVAAGGRAMAVQASVDDAAQVAAMARAVEEGLGPIDTLVLNAKASRGVVFAPVLDLTWEAFHEMVRGELAGVYIPAQAVAPLMAARARGTIIALSSVMSRVPVEGSAGHAAGKAGVDALVKVLAKELGPHGIRVNAVAPGLVETEASAEQVRAWSAAIGAQTPLRRLAQPEDVAGAILLLAAHDARFITGQYVVVDGGLSMP